MNIYDISLTLHPKLAVWPDGVGFTTSRTSSMAEGEEANVTVIHTGAHVGTHVDAPFHFVAGGKTTEALALTDLVGEASVVDFRGHAHIDAAMLAALPPSAIRPRMLFKTDNSALWQSQLTTFHEDFCTLTLDATEWVVAKGIRLVGIDYLSIQLYHDSFASHRVLLGAETVILEGLDLGQVPAGIYELYCLPLKIAGSDGAPARAILVQRP